MFGIDVRPRKAECFDAVLVEEDRPEAVRAAFLDWSEARLMLRGRHW